MSVQQGWTKSSLKANQILFVWDEICYRNYLNQSYLLKQYQAGVFCLFSLASNALPPKPGINTTGANFKSLFCLRNCFPTLARSSLGSKHLQESKYRQQDQIDCLIWWNREPFLRSEQTWSANFLEYAGSFLSFWCSSFTCTAVVIVQRRNKAIRMLFILNTQC